MLHRFGRILMNAQDSSPGGGGTGAPPPDAQAQGQQEPGVVTKDDLANFRNSMFADMRRMMESMVKKPDSAPATPQGAGSAPAPSGGTLTQEDVMKIVTARDALHYAASNSTLSDAGRQRMMRAYEAERPEDPAAWASAYIADHGAAKPTDGAANHQHASAPKPPPNQPGQPPPPTTFTEDTPLWELSTEDRAHLVKTKGAAWYRTKMREQAKNALVKR